MAKIIGETGAKLSTTSNTEKEDMPYQSDPRFKALQKQNEFENQLRVIQATCAALGTLSKDSKYTEELEEFLYLNVKQLNHETI